jgi:hypothetical protein
VTVADVIAVIVIVIIVITIIILINHHQRHCRHPLLSPGGLPLLALAADGRGVGAQDAHDRLQQLSERPQQLRLWPNHTRSTP